MKKNLILMFGVCVCLSAFSVVAKADPCTEADSIRRVYKQVSGNFEYVVIEFVRPATATLQVRTEHPPFYEDGPGDEIKVKGKYFKELDFQGVAWDCVIRENFSTRTSAIIDVKKTGQFEGYITYVIGYGKRGQYVSYAVKNEGKYRRYYFKFQK